MAVGFPCFKAWWSSLENVKGCVEDSGCSCETRGRRLGITIMRGNVRVCVERGVIGVGGLICPGLLLYIPISHYLFSPSMLLSTVTFKRKPDWSNLCSQQLAPQIFHPYWSMMIHVVITYKTTCQAMAEEALHSLLQCKWQWDRIYVGKQYGPLSWQLVLTESMSGGIVLFFSIVVGWQIILVFVDTSFLWKLYQISSGKKKNLLQGSVEHTGCDRNAASQIKWLSCTFTSIFGDISMTIRAETLLKGEGWRCPFTQERAGVIHQRGCCPFGTASSGCRLLTIPPCQARTSLLLSPINIAPPVILCLSGLLWSITVR